MSKTDFVDESLARGLCHRLFNEIEKSNDEIYGAANPDCFDFRSQNRFEKYIEFTRSIYGKLLLMDYVGGGRRKPYLASHTVNVFRNKKFRDNRGVWCEDGLYGGGLIVNTNPYFKSASPAGYRLREHVITRLFQRSKPKYDNKNLIDCYGILNEFKYIPFWWAFWSELLVDQKKSGDNYWGDFANYFRPVIPSPSGLFFCRYTNERIELDVNTFVDDSRLGNDQLFLKKELEKISLNLLNSPMPFCFHYYTIMDEYGMVLDTHHLVMELVCMHLLKSRIFDIFKKETLQPNDSYENSGLIQAEKLKYQMEELLAKKIVMMDKTDYFLKIIKSSGLRKAQVVFNDMRFRLKNHTLK